MASFGEHATTNIERKRLENTTMYINRLKGSEEEVMQVSNLKIPKFSKIEKNIRYQREFSFHQLVWCFCFCKTDVYLTVTLITTSCHRNTTCCINLNDSDKCQRFRTLPTEEIDNGVYEARIGLELHLVPENQLLQQDIVSISFLTGLGKVRGLTLQPSIGTKESEKDLVEMRKNLKKLSVSDTADFYLEAEGKKFPCHKAILSARSKFFCSFFKEDPSRNISGQIIATTKEAMQCFLKYMYVGEAEFCSLKEGLEVLRLSTELKCRSLQVLSTAFVKGFINEKTAHYIKLAGQKSGLDAIVEAADEYLSLYVMSKDKMDGHQ